MPSSILHRHKQPHRAPEGRGFFADSGNGYVEDVLSFRRVEMEGIVDASSMSQLIDKCSAGCAIGVKDDMAIVGILSTKLIVDHFIRGGEQARPHGN